MKNYVFYSWQSDLPNNNNRGFIETCIREALNELNISDKYDIEFSFDKDTLNKTGTPHIADTIFSKIEKAKLFIADVSIINSDSCKRKCPNPNVLVELGYASKALNWDRIICIFNTDYGTYDDLPFDLKYRRPLCYGLNGKNKADEKKRIVSTIVSNIKSLNISEFVPVFEPGSYLILEASGFIRKIKACFNNVLSDVKLQQKYSYTTDKCVIDIKDDSKIRSAHGESCDISDLQHIVSIEFADDKYSFKEISDRACLITIYLKENFKQVNFGDNKVYCIYEITRCGFTPSGKGRNYNKLTDELVRRIRM